MPLLCHIKFVVIGDIKHRSYALVIRQQSDVYRKFVVTLKRNPSIIPLVMLLVTFLLYSLNLTDVSNSTAKIQGKGMGLEVGVSFRDDLAVLT